MTTTLLSRHPQVATTDLDRARSEVAEVFCPHRLEVTGRGGHLDVVHNAAPLAGVGLNYLRYGDEVRITPGTLDEFFLVQVPLAGWARVRVGDQVVASDRRFASLASPTEPVDMVWSADCEQLLVYLRRDVVEQCAGVEGPVVFDPRVDLAAPAVRSWLRMVTLAREELEDGGGLLESSSLAATHFEQVLVAGLLRAQRNSATATPEPAGHSSYCVRTAMDLITDAPEHEWRVAELATRAGVSPRTLQDAFRRDLGTTPMEQLRRTRLERVRADLLDADPTATTVTDIATRWGFSHLGRFAQTYKARYAESPSQTLAR